MTIPLNIDWQQILLHVFNFIILASGLSLLLFKPVRKFMRQREEKYKTSAEEHAKRTAEIAELEKQKQQQLENVESEMEAKRRELLARSEKESKKIVQDAEERARTIVADGQKRAEQERAAYMAQAGDEIARIVVASAEKLLVVGSTPENDSALYDSYLKTAQSDITLSGISEESRNTLAERLSRSARSGGQGEGDVADIVGEATLAAIGKTRTDESDGAIYDEFLRQMNDGGNANG